MIDDELEGLKDSEFLNQMYINQFKLAPVPSFVARNREAIQKVAEAADHLHRQMVNTGQPITWFAESISDMPVYAKCPYCGQGQPDKWDGGGCYYCGGPIDLEFLNKGLESARTGNEITRTTSQ